MEDTNIENAGGIESLVQEIKDCQRTIDEQNEKIRELIEAVF